MKITNIQDTYKIEQELLRALEDITNDYLLGDIGNKTGNHKIDSRWLAIAKTDIEKGFMALRRAMRDWKVVE
jgi:hypothetical protein